MFTETFRQRTLEAFTEYTELLRHFYSILSRQGNQAPLPGTSTEEKIHKILKRLDDTQKKLIILKNEISNKLLDTISMNSQARCISEIVALRSRAHEMWKLHSSNLKAVQQPLQKQD